MAPAGTTGAAGAVCILVAHPQGMRQTSARFFGGSVADKAIDHAHCVVLAVREGRQLRRPRIGLVRRP